MSFADWHSGVTVSIAKQHPGFVCMSTVDDLSYTPSAEERSRDAAQIVATGRRSWKTLKGKGEAVWPPHLFVFRPYYLWMWLIVNHSEAALIEGRWRATWSTTLWTTCFLRVPSTALEKYQPDTSRSTKVLGRFPMRNRFISDYIYETTGKRRTPKQVGSRLQQLRDTCKGERSLSFLCPSHYHISHFRLSPPFNFAPGSE